MSNEVIVTLNELQLADKVFQKGHEHIGVLTVKKILKATDSDSRAVTFFRPYTETANFSFTGGVICYVGIEEFTMHNPATEYVLLERKTLK